MGQPKTSFPLTSDNSTPQTRNVHENVQTENLLSKVDTQWAQVIISIFSCYNSSVFHLEL